MKIGRFYMSNNETSNSPKLKSCLSSSKDLHLGVGLDLNLIYMQVKFLNYMNCFGQKPRESFGTIWTSFDKFRFTPQVN